MDSRRQFLARSGAAAAAAVLAPQDALAAKRRQKRPQDMLRGGRFSQGVLSGDPAQNAITLLTKVERVGGAGRVRLEVARDPDFRRVVARRDILTTPAIDHSVKARVTGLKPHKRYYYRFETRDRHSPVGRFQTALPPDSRETVRFGFFSCADYTHGYYNAYAALAREDVDFVIALGDYIYAETFNEVGDGRAVRNDPIGQPNPYYRAPLREAATLSEYRAKSQIYRSQPHGRTMELIMLDERQYRANQPCGDAVALPCSTWDRQRTILGNRQRAFLEGRLKASKAAWKVIGGQSLIMPNRVHDGQFARFDSWQGYPQEREHLLNHIAGKGIKDVVFLAGDVHTVVAGDVNTQMGAGPSVAIEFAAGSVTSANVGESNFRMPAGQLLPGNNAEPSTPPEVMAHYR